MPRGVYLFDSPGELRLMDDGRLEVENVIFGGGIAGLWLLDDLVQSGRSALLLEAGALGERADGRFTGNHTWRAEIHTAGCAHPVCFANTGNA